MNELQQKYLASGISVECDYSSQKITDVRVDLNNDDWMDLLNKEGELLPACCGDISRSRDILINAIREGKE